MKTRTGGMAWSCKFKKKTHTRPNNLKRRPFEEDVIILALLPVSESGIYITRVENTERSLHFPPLCIVNGKN